MMPPAPSRAAGRLVAALAATVLAWPGPTAGAQTALPTVQLNQIPGEGSLGFGGTARARLDRDAFLVVFEIGADHRARVIYPARPSDGAWTRAGRSVWLPLPSADAVFIRSAELRVPDIVAFVSDLEPNLAEFTERGRRWDYQYSVNPGEPLEFTVESLATLLYGDPDLPFTVVTRREYPVVNRSVFAMLSRCGYNLNSPYSPAFNNFMWQAFGPLSLAEIGWSIDSRYLNFQWEGRYWFLASLSSAGIMNRAVAADLWNTFGNPCGPLGMQDPFFLNGWIRRPIAQGPLPPSTTPVPPVPVPTDRNPEARPPVVPGVEIVPAGPEGPQDRARAVTRLASAVAETRASARGPLTRESNEELVKRQEIATVMSLLASQRQYGRGSLDVMDVFQRVRSGETLVADNDGRVTRAPRGSRTVGGRLGSSGEGRFGGGGDVFGGRASGGSGGGGSIGSGSMSGGGEARGGGGESRGGSSSGGGRGSGSGGGTGRP